MMEAAVGHYRRHVQRLALPLFMVSQTFGVVVGVI